MANKNSCTYKIVTDSTSDLTPKLVEELDVEVIPMEFIFGDEVYHNYPARASTNASAVTARQKPRPAA